jgi:hypothetical protein
MTPAKMLGLGVVWFAASLAVGALNVLSRLPAPVPQIILVSLTALLLVASKSVRSFRDWLASANLKCLVAIHLLRFVGIYFLVLHARGELPYAFAVPGGIGDICVATAAIAILCVDPSRSPGRKLWVAWNALGLMDILLVVATAARLGITDPASMQALTHLPLSLLPTFLVPLIIASHIVLFGRLAGMAGR